MAARKTHNFLPTVFQTDTNKKFLSATVDQLVSEPDFVNLYGYIGRKFAPTFKSADSYVTEPNTSRQNYQLEPSVVIKDSRKNITFFATYLDLLDKIKHYGGDVNNHSRLFEQEYYSFDPRISYDKLVNFSQYYWLPNGPNPVAVNTSGIDLNITYVVTRDAANGRYVFTNNGVVDNSIILARGGTYNFVVNQPGVPFWIQSEIGIDGKVAAAPTLSSRNVAGVTNNGADVGTVTFQVPQTNAQDRWLTMPTVATVDYATPITYNNFQNKTLSQFLAAFPQYAGIASQLNGKYLIFVNQQSLPGYGETSWVTPQVHDNQGNPVAGYDYGNLVPEAQRFNVWRVGYVDAGITNADGSNDPLLRLLPDQIISDNQKVYIKYGLANANKEYYKDYDGFLYQMPLLTATLDNLYIQDGTSSDLYDFIKIVNYSGWIIDVEKDILTKSKYTSPNGVEFTSGLKVHFGSDVTPAYYQNRQFYVEQVGDSTGIRLVPVDELVIPEAYNDNLALNYPGEIFPDYVTINRASIDRNAWSRNNRWFHIDVVTASKTPVTQASRGQRPIIQFDCDLQLFNEGRVGLSPVDVLDTSTVNAFADLQGKTFSTAFGITLTNGLRVIFAADNDPLVKNKIYVVNLVQYTIDSEGVPSGDFHVELTLAEDGNVPAYSSVVVKQGQYKGSQWWFDGVNWNASQTKTALQQDPLFDVLDPTGKSFSTYTRSTFAGTKLFGYVRATTGVSDSVLSRGIIPTIYDSNGNPVTGYYLSYKTFQAQGDIKFQNYYNTDTFSYVNGNDAITAININLGYLQKIIDAGTLAPKNTWQTVPENSRQYQQISYVYDGTNNPFAIDVAPAAQASIPSVKVYQNFTYLQPTQWTLANGTVTISATLTVGDQIDILVYSNDVSKLGFYQVPQNLDLNAQNVDIDTLTLGQVRNHLVALAQNSTIVKGNILGQSNLRDIDIKQQGGTILQHSAPVPYSSLFLIDKNANFVDSLRHAQQEYSKFKNKFLELSVNLPGIKPTDPAASVDIIMTKINTVKNKSFPWYYSDMVPYGVLKNIVGGTNGITVFDPLKTNYEITNIFNDQALSNQAVLVYLNGVQLSKNIDYTFSTTTPSINFAIGLNVGDVLTIVEYSNTDGNYIPETPTKLGLWPIYIPEKFVDDTYRNPITVIRGHDGSITPSFGDYRDDLLLELELRIYNNIKLPSNATFGDIFSVVPGKFRRTDYSLQEINQLTSPFFLNWIGNNKLDFSSNTTFDANDAFTWNYAADGDVFDGEALPGSWRACFQYYYDTFRPHQAPWEMLGFAAMPDWWEGYYGVAPYTGANKVLWDDLEAGLVRFGPRAGVDVHYKRPGLSRIIPVDENGNLRSPVGVLAAVFNSKRASDAWAVGQYGPVEYAWRVSSDFPFAVQQALALAKPAKYFGALIDTYNYTPLNLLNTINELPSGTIIGAEQYLTLKTNHHITQDVIDFNGDASSGTVYRGAGYLNWIADYLINQGVAPANYITPLLKNFQVNLSYKTAGFTDQKYIEVLAEQVSPTSTNDSILIPNENYNVYLNENPVPVGKLFYSAVIVEKTTNGYSVRGYDLNNSYFTIIPSVANTNATNITVLNKTATIYKNYQNLKLNVPYGFEYHTPQQLCDFLVSYERYLISQGFTFEDVDPQLNEMRNWRLSVKEFLYWIQQGWKAGSIIVLSPVAETLNAVTNGSITAGIEDSQFGSKVVDQNFNLVKNNNYTVLRTPTSFKLRLSNPASVLAYVEIDLVQYEHALVFDNATVFNDVIYQPESGNRQYRLKLIGQKTAQWDGSLSAPGFVYSSGVVKDWNQGKDYLQGDLVQYKNRYYTALQDVIASPSFEFKYWQEIAQSQIQKGLLPNFSTVAVQAQSYYDSYPVIKDHDQMAYSHALIGFKPRQYLADLGLTETTQIEFYKGFIKQKGTANAINQMLKATFNNLSSEIDFYEEWAMRVGEYGALNSNPFIEIPLNEKAFAVNPSVANFVSAADNNLGNGLTTFNESQLYKSYGKFTGNIALNRTQHSDYDQDIPTAGYVNIDDVDLTIYDLANYLDLDNNIAAMGSGYRIWCAKDFNQTWNVYRVTETNNQVKQVDNALNGYITFTTKAPHKLVAGNVFLVKNFNSRFDGFYRVVRAASANTLLVTYTGDTSKLTTITGIGELYRMDSVRFLYMEDSRIYGLDNPPNGWKVGDKIWIDDDAQTTAVQGQPYGTQPSGTWKVYEKTHPWNYDQQLTKQYGEYGTDNGYGSSVKMSSDGLIVVTGSPGSGAGVVNTFLKDYAGAFNESFSISPLGSNTSAFGSTVDLGTDASSNTVLAVGAPASYGNVGYVYIYNKDEYASAFAGSQIIVGNVLAAGDLFGASLAFSQTGDWLYIGAPGNIGSVGGNKVYVYGLQKNITPQQQTISVKNTYTLTLSSPVSLVAGDTITQPITGATARVEVNATANTRVIVDNLINFNITGMANVTVGNVTTLQWANINTIHDGVSTTTTIHPTATHGDSVTTSLTLNFIPQVTNDPSSLLITNSSQTFIPNVDYYLSGSTINFITAGNIASPYYISEGDVSIKQKPYYQLVKTLTIPTGNIGAQFGYALSSSFDGAQLAVGTPNDTVMGTGNVLLPGAGSVYVYDRVIEAFDTFVDCVPGSGGQDYQTKNNIASVYKVTLDNVEVTNYTVIAANKIRFSVPPEIGHRLYIEVNQFALLERLIGVDSLSGGLQAIQANAAFGTSLTICSNNCAIYVGAPNYNKGTEYNSGAVWKFHNRGRLYGTNTGYVVNPVFMPGDTFRLDNFEISVSGRMLPTTLHSGTGNILALSGTIRANVGDYITQTVSGANLTVLVSTPVTGSQFITVGSIDANTLVTSYSFANLTYGAGNVAVNGNASSVYPMASLDSLVKDVNDAGLLGISATNDAGRLRLNSDSTVAKNLLRILSGSNTAGSPGVYASADLIIFAFMQIIVNPFGKAGEYFGNKVKLASNAYMLVIGSARGTTKEFTTFDIDTTANGTTFDDTSTRIYDSIYNSGSVYVYELYDDPRNAVEHPGRYAFAQQIDPGDLEVGSKFGSSIDIEGTFITVGAPGHTVNGDPIRSGTVYIFQNPTMTRGWKLIRYQQPQVDINSVNRIYLYNNQTSKILSDLQFIDPAKGKILGEAEQDIAFKTEYDPAIYNRGTDVNSDINSDVYWGAGQIGKVWWNLSKVRYLNYEQDTLTYRSLYWGELFPGSVIDILEWVKSPYLPSQYVANGGDGVPKHPNNEAYVEEVFVDAVTGIISTQYYYWVGGKTTVDPNNETRSLPTTVIADYIQNPKNQNIAFAAMIRNDAIAFYNAGQYLSANNTIMHLDSQILINTDIIHSEYELVQRGNPNNNIPSKIVNKLIDSLAGINSAGATVPDPKLSLADRYGIGIRPRQSMFADRLRAVVEMVSFVNVIFAKNPIAEQFDLAGLNAQDPIPNFKLGEFDQQVETEAELAYIDTLTLDPGYLVLVLSDTTQQGLWVLYELMADKTWAIARVQAYKTSLYWTYADWYADGYSAATKPTFSVATTNDALKLLPFAGDIIYISNATGRGTWQLVVVEADGSLSVVGIQNGTVQLDPALGDFAGNRLGFGNQDFDSNRYDQNPNNEIRVIVQTLNDDLFTNTLKGEFNNMFFILVNYLLTEQNYVDWLFKSSFISVTHKLRTLSQFPSYVVDNQTYYQNYIEEVKPYRTKIREYRIDYTGNDTYLGNATDFDLPPYFDTSTGYGIFRSPSGENPYTESDSALWQSFPYNQWYNNRTLQLGLVAVENAGYGYATPPIVTIVTTDGQGFGANAVAIMTGNVGNLRIESIQVVDSGTGYITTPTVIINGSATVAARAYAVMENHRVRSFDTAIKFDRVSYDSSVQYWAANTHYTAGQIVSYAQPDGNVMIRKAYMVNANITTGTSFIPTDYTVYSANLFNNANDRIIGYYEPSSLMPTVDSIIVPITLANAAVNTNTIYVFNAANMISGMYINGGGVDAGYITGIRANVTFMTDIGDESYAVTTGNVTANSYVITNVGNLDKANIGQYVDALGLPFETTIVNFGNINGAGNVIVLNNKATITSGNITVTTSGVPIKLQQVTLSTNVTLATDSTITARYDSVDQLVPGVDYPNLPIVGASFKLGPLYGRSFDVTTYDGVQYSADGLPLLSTSQLDQAIYSKYTQSLGIAPEDIVTGGGAYVDTYHSHAPEELVPGIMFDTLDMRIYTKINGNANVVAYRVFDNMMSETNYLRISSAATTTLAQPLYMTDSNIYVQNASVLPTPDAVYAVPGVIFINGERITYYTVDLVNNVLGRVRRGTQGTATPAVHGKDSQVIDASPIQTIPGTSSGNVYIYANVLYNSGVGTALDGTGLTGSTTPGALFLKANTAPVITVSVGLVTEDAINILTTENGNEIYNEG